MSSAILGPLLGNICEVYLDDILIYAKTEKDFKVTSYTSFS